MKIVNVPRFLTSLTIIVLLLSFFTSMITTTVFSAAPEEYDEVIVSAGDTLWSIAITLDGDINENIYKIKKINKLESPLIFEGQKLLIPAIS